MTQLNKYSINRYYQTKHVLLIICMLIMGFCERTPHSISQQTFQQLFHMSMNELGQTLSTPAKSNKMFKKIAPYQSFFILFYNPLYDSSLEVRQVFHKFYAQYESQLTNYFRKNGAKQYQQFQELFANALQVGEVDCSLSQDICQIFRIKGYPTLLFITGHQLNSNSHKYDRQVYEYTSRLSIQDLLYFTLKAYNHRSLDLQRVKIIQIENNFISNLFLYLYNQTIMYVMCFLLMPFLFGYCVMAKVSKPIQLDSNVKKNRQLDCNVTKSKNE